MDNYRIQIPFVLNGRNGIAEVCYEENKSVSKSGFDLLRGLGFNAEMCIGYPTLHAYVKKFDGTGYYTGSAWIQIITDKFYSYFSDGKPSKVVSEVDISDTMRNLGVPFFCMGYPAEIYDAPCNNLGNYGRLEWIADTFLVTLPSRINDETISYLLGFRWGYEEGILEGERNIRILPIEVTDYTVWNEHLTLLRNNFPHWTFNKF